jgi:predicted RNA-binding Zn-ribbon protein involved in translation (DUF1610 family)
MTDQKIHVRENNTATLVCPNCGTVKHFDADRFRNHPHTFSVRCRCQQVFSVLIDFRRYYRKQTNLYGTYVILSKGGVGGGLIHITNISRGGMGFTVSGTHRIEKDQLIQVEFQLNDKNKTVINKQAIVRSVRQNVVGCEFQDSAELDKALGFFLRN